MDANGSSTVIRPLMGEGTQFAQMTEMPMPTT